MRRKPVSYLKAMAALCAILFTACQQNNFKLKGTTEGINDGDTIFLFRHASMSLPSDTIVVSKGGFMLSGQADTATLGMLYLQSNPNISTTLFIEPGTIEVSLSAEPEKTVIGGTDANIALQRANTIANMYGQRMLQLTRMLNGEHISEHNGLLIMSQLNSLQADMKRRIIDLAEQNMDNEFGYMIVTNLSQEDLSPQKRHQLIEKMPEKYRKRLNSDF